ncbi:hypothetical protein E4U53_002230 [Claviceps sorghi]|nr:hypothetical protein E4U53_002230 [Claviceps sorghi]
MVLDRQAKVPALRPAVNPQRAHSALTGPDPASLQGPPASPVKSEAATPTKNRWTWSIESSGWGRCMATSERRSFEHLVPGRPVRRAARILHHDHVHAILSRRHRAASFPGLTIATPSAPVALSKDDLVSLPLNPDLIAN